MTTNEFLRMTMNKEQLSNGTFVQTTRPWIICKDDFSVSVQAGCSLYSDPRIDFLDTYEKVELGFPNMEDELITDYAEDPDNLTDTVYGYVPVEIVDKLIEKHGGIIGRTFTREDFFISIQEIYDKIKYFRH